MPRPTRFWKLSGAGNDFVLVEGPLPRARELAPRLCDRREGVGADGLLLVARGGRRLRALYLNADGSRAFCGNGARCAAWWMREHGWAGRAVDFTLSGVAARAVVGRGSVRLRMPDVAPPRRLRLALDGRRLAVDLLDTGVPHAVVRVPSGALDRYPVPARGRLLRRHRALGTAGANADFAALRGGVVRLRTYERGVEDETLACGTGATAAALAAHGWVGLPSPVRVEARGGLLAVSFSPRKDGGFSDVCLEGPVRQCFTGEVAL